MQSWLRATGSGHRPSNGRTTCAFSLGSCLRHTATAGAGSMGCWWGCSWSAQAGCVQLSPVSGRCPAPGPQRSRRLRRQRPAGGQWAARCWALATAPAPEHYAAEARHLDLLERCTCTLRVDGLGQRGMHAAAARAAESRGPVWDRQTGAARGSQLWPALIVQWGQAWGRSSRATTSPSMPLFMAGRPLISTSASRRSLSTHASSGLYLFTRSAPCTHQAGSGPMLHDRCAATPAAGHLVCLQQPQAGWGAPCKAVCTWPSMLR